MPKQNNEIYILRQDKNKKVTTVSDVFYHFSKSLLKTFFNKIKK